MLEFYKVEEALAELNQRTSRQWTESIFFDFIVRHRMSLHAAPDKKEPLTGGAWELAGWVTRNHTQWRLAILGPDQVGQLWLSGCTEAKKAYTPELPELCAEFSPPLEGKRPANSSCAAPDHR